ncbi:MAG TPA: FkbM family methyltransferase [Phycisphaerae bacterium]|nr:FkbM family methyltransferase [Phycisphaerae bacterium]
MARPDLTYIDQYYGYAADLMGQAPCVIEVGTSSLHATAALRKTWPLGRYALFEADPGAYAHLAALDLPDGVTAHHAALADADGQARFHRSKRASANSLFKGVATDETVTVEGVRLSTMMGVAGFEMLDLLLLNCEGGEVYALAELVKRPELTERVKQVCVSFHCDHVHHYPPVLRDVLLDALRWAYEVTPLRSREYDYWLLTWQEGP